MVKEKSKGAKGAPNKHLHARILFLQKAAEYLASQERESRRAPAPHSANRDNADDVTRGTTLPVVGDSTTHSGEAVTSPNTKETAMTQLSSTMPAYMCSQLRQVALKSQIRLSRTVKQAVCKRCNSILVEGQTCNRFVENLSRGNKAHADVLVLECRTCGGKKRFPTKTTRQKRKCERETPIGPVKSNTESERAPSSLPV
jgi:ribonuclease P protein subunit RPR2